MTSWVSGLQSLSGSKKSSGQGAGTPCSSLAAGIQIDAFVVRLTLVPALMAVFNERAWWLHRWLDRLLPDLDIEGDRLLTMLNQQAEATDRQGHQDPRMMKNSPRRSHVAVFRVRACV